MKRFQWVAMYVGRPFQQQDPSGANPPCWNMCKIGALTPSVIRDAVICSSQRGFDQRWLLLHARRAAGWESTRRKKTTVNISSVLTKHGGIHMTCAFHLRSAISNHYGTQMSNTAPQNNNSFHSGRPFCRYLGPCCIQSYKELIGKIRYLGIN